MGLKERYARTSPLGKALLTNSAMLAVFISLFLFSKTPTINIFILKILIVGFFVGLFSNEKYSPPLWLYLLGKLGKGLISAAISAAAIIITILGLALFKAGPISAIISFSIVCAFMIHAAIDGNPGLRKLSKDTALILYAINFFFLFLIFYLPYRLWG